MILRPLFTVVGLCLAAVALNGCSRGYDVVPPVVAAPDVAPTCPRDGKELGLPGAGPGPNRSGAVAPGFAPTQVVWCRVTDDVETLGGGAIRFTVTPQTAEPNPALLTALRLPDHRQDDAVCQTSFPLPTVVILVDPQGHAVRPRLPRDPCDLPRKEVTDALHELTFTLGKPFQVTVTEAGQ